MTSPPRQVLIALSRELWTVHRAYIKSLEGAKLEVVEVTEIEDLLARDSAGVALVVTGVKSGIEGVSGVELLTRLDQLDPPLKAPVLFLQAPGVAPVEPPSSSLKLLRRWNQAREALKEVKAIKKSSAPKPKAPAQPKISYQPVKLKSEDKTLEIIAPPPQSDASGEAQPEAPVSVEVDSDLIVEPAQDDKDEERATDQTVEMDELPAFSPPSRAPAPEPASSTPEPASSTPEPASQSPMVDSGSPPSRSRRPVVIALVGLVLAALASAAIVLALGRDGDAVGQLDAASAAPAPPPATKVGDAGATGSTETGAVAMTFEVDADPSAGDADLSLSDADLSLSDAEVEGGDGDVEASTGAQGTVLPLRFGRNHRRPHIVNWREMRRVVRAIKRDPSIDYVLVGHASPDERPRYAKRLGLLRAKLVRDLICSRGPSRSRFEARSAGVDQPLATAPEGLSTVEASRRVVLVPVEP